MDKDKNRRAVCAAVSRILKEEREKRQMPLSAVADGAGISYQMVGMVEKQERNPTLDTLLRICSALSLDFESVIRRAKAAAQKR